MKPWQIDQLRLVRAATTEEQTFAAVLQDAQAMGFEFASFGMKAPIPLVAPRVAWCSNYPAEWQRIYEERGYLLRDPSVGHALHHDHGVLWSDELFEHAMDIRQAAAEFGICHGWAQPRRDARGMVSLLTVSRSQGAITEAEMALKSPRIQWLSHLCHEGMQKVWSDALYGGPQITLSERELDVLRWSGEGKTSADIAQIMGISEATVNFHTRNACHKLGSVNKTAAAVRAALLGLLN